jgi:peptidyl-prolyl cis-trans isomerase C
VLDLVSRYQIPAGNEDQVYHDAIDTLVNNRLIVQFLNRQKFPVKEEDVNNEITRLESQLKADGTSLAAELLRSGKSMAQVRKEFAERIRWVNYLNSKATEPELERFAQTHKDLFSGTKVRASHILLKVDPKASAADKEKLREKLLSIKKDLDSNKLSFAEAANKYSEDLPANAEGAGGDVGYFGLNEGFIEEFAKPAFAMKKGDISDPVETPYGLHLIQVTDRKEGPPFDVKQNLIFVKQMYAADLMKNLLAAERKTAKLDVKPMPADMFPQPPASPAGAAPAPAQAKSEQPKATTPR